MPRITSCSTLVYTEASLEDALLRISSHGFERVEVASLASYCKHFDESEVNPDEVKRLFKQYGLTPVALNYSTNREDGYRYRLNVAEEADAVETKLRALLLKAHEAGIPLVNTGPGQRNDSPERRNEVEKAAELISRMAEYAKTLGIKLTLEVPHCWLLCNTLERTAEMFSLISSKNVGAVMDSTHWHVIGYDIDEFMKIMGSRLCHVHLRDAAGPDTGDFKQKLELTPGKGEIDFEKFGWYLDRYGYQGDVSLEFEYRGKPIAEVEAEFSYGVRYLSTCGWELPQKVKKYFGL